MNTCICTDKNGIPSSARLSELEQHVQARLGNRLRDFHIVPAKCGLILKGCTTTYYAKQLAQQAILEFGGQTILSNDILVIDLEAVPQVSARSAAGDDYVC
jgi:hypothetical protein